MANEAKYKIASVLGGILHCSYMPKGWVQESFKIIYCAKGNS